MKNDILICNRLIKEPTLSKFITHAHDKWEFIFVTKGNPICMTEGRRYSINEKTLMVFKPAQIHRVQEFGVQPYEYFSLMCDEFVLSPQVIDIFSNSTGFFTFNNPEAIYQKFLEISRQNENADQPSSIKTRRSLVEELLHSVLEDMNVMAVPVLYSEDPVVSAAISYIDANVQEVTRVAQICDVLGITKQKLYSRFIQSMLISPMKYVRAKRVALAKAAASEKKQAELLNRYGFADKVGFDQEYEYYYKSIP